MIYKVMRSGEEVVRTKSQTKAHYYVRVERSFGSVELYANISDEWILLSRHDYKLKKNLT